MSLRLKVLNLGLRWFEKRSLARMTSVAEARSRFERQAERNFRMPPDTHSQTDRLKSGDREVPVLWVSQGKPSRRSVFLYFHGGAYVIGSPKTHAALVARIAGSIGARGLLPDYRLAPEHPFPAAVDDALACYKGLLEAGYAPERILLGGDSAGGGLALALLHVLKVEEIPRPAACCVFSPWTDLSLSGLSIEQNQRLDVVLPRSRMEEMVGRYLNGTEPTDPRASPLFGDFSLSCPILIQASRSEMLQDDAIRMAEMIQASGGDVVLEMWRDTPHCWQIFQGLLPEADKALASVSQFLGKHIPDAGNGS